MSLSSASETWSLEKWIVVDLERILRLPARLRRLWPPDLAPRRTDAGAASKVGTVTDGGALTDVGPGGSTAPMRGSASAGVGDEDACTTSVSTGGTDACTASVSTRGTEVVHASVNTGSTEARTVAAGEEAEVVDLGESVRGSRELDVLTAWLAGFAAELNQSDGRITVVVSSGVESVHLALCLGAVTGQAVLALRGEGFEDFADHQLLRRIDPSGIGRAVDELAGLVEGDCVLTLNWAARGGHTGLEFLHRRGGAWFRPVLERSGGSITVDEDAAAGDEAVRMLLAAVLTRVLPSGVR